MKVFEKIVFNHLKTFISQILDPAQFAYRANRCVEDAVALTIHHILEHLEKSNTYARVLFIDYSSAFNTIVPYKLYKKLLSMSFDPTVCNWLLDFLLNRPQFVKFNNMFSNTIVLNTGAPQGCVLSPILYSLFTNDCRSSNDSVKIVKFADDTTITGLISNSDEKAYLQQINDLILWCDKNNLILNASKTKEMIFDFRKNKSPITPLQIKNENIELVNNLKFLGTIISSDFKWYSNTQIILKKAHQRLYFLRHLKKFNLNDKILTNFYRAIIESILTFSIIIWFKNLSQSEKRKLNKVIIHASRIIGTSLPSLENLYLDRLNTRTTKILKDQTHPANIIFELLPSGKRYRSIKIKTTRFGDSLFPNAIRFLNTAYR